MPETSADRFRRKAEECRQFAESTANQLERVAWLKLTSEWMKMAKVADKYGDKAR
jgi:hypothetical protein